MGLDVARVAALRKKLGLSQEQAAEAAGIGSRQRWNDIESGRKANVSIETLELIAKALGVSAKSLLMDRSDFERRLAE